MALKVAGIRKSHAYQIAAKAKNGTLTLPVALRTWRVTKMKLGPIAGATDAKIGELMRITGIAA